MTNKERLDAIKGRSMFNQLAKRTGEITHSLVTLDEEDYDWLIEQAERVQELEKRLKIYQRRSWFEDYEKVAKQNKRYREALEFYADERNYEERDFGVIKQNAIQEGDKGNTARKALEG